MRRNGGQRVAWLDDVVDRLAANGGRGGQWRASERYRNDGGRRRKERIDRKDNKQTNDSRDQGVDGDKENGLLASHESAGE